MLRQISEPLHNINLQILNKKIDSCETMEEFLTAHKFIIQFKTQGIISEEEYSMFFSALYRKASGRSSV